jgi:hypothetical protein
MTPDELIQYKHECQKLHESLNREIYSSGNPLPYILLRREKSLANELHAIYLELERRAVAAKMVKPTSYEQWLSSSW